MTEELSMAPCIGVFIIGVGFGFVIETIWDSKGDVITKSSDAYMKS